jgi:signal transduction histidine kinase
MGHEVAPGSLFAVLKENRSRLISRWEERTKSLVVDASLPRAELLDHIPAFVDEITGALYPEAMPLPPSSAHADEHGGQRLRLGFDVAEVIREYGLLHECILEIAGEAGLEINARDHAIVARWLNVGIAGAVAQYVKERDLELQRKNSEHLGFIAHELRNPVALARLAFDRLRKTELAESRTADMLDRGLRRTADMIDGVLSHASLKMGIEPRLAPVVLLTFLQELVAEAATEARAKSIHIITSCPDDLTVQADLRLLRSAVTNLLHNAMKFSHDQSTVTVTAGWSEGRITIEVADGCGGLAPGKADELFAPLVQRNDNRTGFGLGLGIALQAAEAHNGTIRVKDMPGTGCAFIIDLPSTSRTTSAPA